MADLPQKHRREHAAKAVSTAPELDGLIAGAQQEVLLQTPYLVLSDQAQAIFRTLRKHPQPPRIVVSTNSLAATDNPIVYALSYKFKRRNMRELGFNVYEFKPFPLDAPVDYANLVTDPLNPASDVNQDSRNNRLIGGSAAGNAMRGSSGPEGNASASAGSVLRGSGGGRAPGGSEVDRRVLRTETRPSFLGTRAVNKPLPVTRAGARMGLHNKLLVVDDVLGVVGGRNYQDDYYDWDSEYNFRDRDVILAGPEVRAMAANFDAFWRARRSVPAERLNDVGRLLLEQGVPTMPPAEFRRPDRVARVDREAHDPQFVRDAFVTPAMPVKRVLYV